MVKRVMLFILISSTLLHSTCFNGYFLRLDYDNTLEHCILEQPTCHPAKIARLNPFCGTGAKMCIQRLPRLLTLAKFPEALTTPFVLQKHKSP